MLNYEKILVEFIFNFEQSFIFIKFIKFNEQTNKSKLRCLNIKLHFLVVVIGTITVGFDYWYLAIIIVNNLWKINTIVEFQ